MILVSSFVFVISLYFVYYYFHYACRSIVRHEFEKDYSSAVANANHLEFLAVRQTLAQGATPSAYETMIDSLERDFQTLTYLLRNAATVHVGHYSHQERMLILDYHLLRAWLRLKQLVGAMNVRNTLVEMTDILNYFANVMGHRAATFSTVAATY